MVYDIYQMLDTTALEQHQSKQLLTDLRPHIEKFEELAAKNGIKGVTVLSNFGKDIEMSLKYDTDIYRGVIVQTDAEYKLTEYDRLWFHPELCKGRSMYDGGEKNTSNKIDIDSFNSSVGVYSTHAIDEIGGYKQETYTIVDSGMEEESEVLLNSWILSSTNMRSIYNELVGAKLVQKAQAKRDEIANLYKAKERILTSNYNMLYSDRMSYYFYNHGIKPQKGKALLSVSPLMGCAVVSSEKNHIESDLLSSDKYININKLTEEQRDRAFLSCNWDGKNIVNTYIMRKPVDNFQTILESHNVKMYRLEKGYFSANPVHSKLPADIVLYLTPDKNLIPSKAVCHQHIRDGSIDMPATMENINKLMASHWRTLISKRYVNGDSLILPREMVEKSLI